jgi:hypothetical protein
MLSSRSDRILFTLSCAICIFGIGPYTTMIHSMLLSGERHDFGLTHWDVVYYGSRTFLRNLQTILKGGYDALIYVIVLMFNVVMYVLVTLVPFYSMRTWYRWVRRGQ